MDDSQGNNDQKFQIPKSETLQAVNLQSDNLWHLMQQSRSLQDFRKEIRLSWDDQASKEINKRYLDPHEEENNYLLDKLRKLSENVALNEKKYKSISNIIREAGALSVELSKLLQNVQEDIQIAYTHHDQSLEDIEVSKKRIKDTAELIDKANSACDGIPTE